MSKEKDIIRQLKEAGLVITDADAALCEHYRGMAHSLLPNSSPDVINHVVFSLINAGRLMGANQITARNEAAEQQQKRNISAFLAVSAKKNPEGVNN